MSNEVTKRKVTKRDGVEVTACILDLFNMDVSEVSFTLRTAGGDGIPVVFISTHEEPVTAPEEAAADA